MDDTEAAVAAKIAARRLVADDALAAALERIHAEKEAFGWSGADADRVFAALNRALEVTDPFQNQTKGGTFMAALDLEVREAILAELTGEGTTGG